MDKVIIYCRTYDDYTSIYLHLRSKLRKEMTEPVGARNLQNIDWLTCLQPAQQPLLRMPYYSPSVQQEVTFALL